MILLFLKEYESITCTDKSGVCETYASACNTGAAINGVDINSVCPRTCGVCDNSALSCKNSTFLCQNGGLCKNLPSHESSELVGFKCECPKGFTGYLCEVIDRCQLNPCQNGGKCQNFGSGGYICDCPKDFSGYNCSKCK